MSAPNGSTKFELAWLIFWIILSTVLLVLAVLKKLPVPNLIKGDKIFSMIFAFLQLLIWILLLSALAVDRWTESGWGRGYGWYSFGVTGTSSSNDYHTDYNCNYGDSDTKNYCRTIQTAGAFTLIFGLIGIFTSFALLILVGLSLAGQPFLAQFMKHVPVMANIQWICLQAMVIIWGVSGHDPIKQGGGNVRLGDSWALAFTDFLFALAATLFFAGGPGVTARGASSQPAVSAGPTQEPTPVAVQPAATQ